MVAFFEESFSAESRLRSKRGEASPLAFSFALSRFRVDLPAERYSKGPTVESLPRSRYMRSIVERSSCSSMSTPLAPAT
jgi:hypothetical protein